MWYSFSRLLCSVVTTKSIWATCSSLVVLVTITSHMFKAFGVVIIFWYMSSLFTQTFLSMDRALSATFHTLEVAAVASEKQFVK